MKLEVLLSTLKAKAQSATRSEEQEKKGTQSDRDLRKGHFLFRAVSLQFRTYHNFDDTNMPQSDSEVFAMSAETEFEPHAHSVSKKKLVRRVLKG